MNMKPEIVAKLWAYGMGDLYCAHDEDLPISKPRRLFWRIRGEILTALFSWWWWEKVQ
jgi:hypothetical protein